MKPQPEWPQAIATVLACHYKSGAGRALAFGIPTFRHYRISFNYWAPDQQNRPTLYTAELTSEKPMPQGTLFPIRYNPENPNETRTDLPLAP